MDDQRARVADIGEMREQLHVRDELHAGVVAALEAEGEHRARALRHVFLGEAVILVARQAGIADPRDLRMLREPFGDRLRVVAMALHAQRQRLDAGEDQERVERRERRAHVAQAEHAAGDGEGEIAERLVQHDAVVFRARLGQHRIALLARPVERAAIDDHAADRVAVAAEKLRQRVHDDVGAVVDRLAEVGRRQRVVDDQRHAGAFCAISAIASMSVMTPPGLAIDSMKIALVFGETARSKVEMSSGSAHTTFQPKFLNA